MYITSKVEFALTPQSSFTTDKGETITFAEYYHTKRGISIQDMNQPLLHARRSQKKDQLLIPELCHLTSITAEVLHCARDLPHVWSHITTYAKIDALQKVINLRFHNVRLLKQALTHSSYSNENSEPMVDYQRLEFIGDAVLEIIVTTQLFHKFPNVSEGKLFNMKSALVNNSLLSHLAQSIDLFNYAILSTHHSPHEYSVDKIGANLLESIIGAIYLDQGLDNAKQFFWSLAFPSSSDPLTRYWLSEEAPSTTPTAQILPFAEVFLEVENIIEFTFHNKSLLMQCFIHPTYCATYNYQGLEFLGDVILKLVVSEHLYRNYPESTEGQLSRCRSQVVKNDYLAHCSTHMGLEKFVLHNQPQLTFDGPKLRKVAADVLEALIAAIFLEMGYPACYSWVEKIVFSPTPLSPCSIVLDPVSQYQQVIQRASGGVRPVYKILSITHTIYGPVFEVGVFVEGTLMARAEGQTKRQAAMAAACNACEEWTKRRSTQEDFLTVEE